MIGYEDFFAFEDSSPLANAIKEIERFESAVLKMQKTVEESSGRLAGEFSEIQANAGALLDSTKKLNAGMEANEKQLNDTSKASEDLVKDFLALKNVEAENAKQLVTLQGELEKVTKAKDKLKGAVKSEAGSFDDLKVRLVEAEKAYKAMGSTTDSAIKDEQLQKVRGLAAEFKAVNGVLTDAKKSATVVAGSYNELAARVAEAKKQLKDMEGGLDGNTKEFKELQKFAKEGTDQLKDFDDIIGDSQRNVGGYQGAIVAAVTQLKSIPGAAGMANTALKILSSNPIIFTLLAIGAAVSALTAYFHGSIEGQDDLNKVMRTGEAILSVFMSVVKMFGKALFEAISNPKKLLADFITVLKEVWKEIVYAFENPVETLKKFGQAILDNIISRFVGMGKVFEAVGKIIKSGFTDGFKDLTNAAIQMATGVEDAVDKIVKAFEPLTDEMIRRKKLGDQIAALENKLRKDRIADILDDAKTELAVTRLLQESQDKLRFTSEERFNKLRELNKFREDQLQGDLDLIRDEISLQQLLIQQNGETYESRQALVELQAKELGLQTEFFKQRKKRQAEEIALIREIQKETLDARKRTAEAEAALNTVRLNDIIKDNDKILAEENSSLEERFQAIQENDAAKLRLLEQDRDKELALAKESAIALVQVDGEKMDAIIHNDALKWDEKLSQIRTLQEEGLADDVDFQTQTLKIQEDFTNKSNDLLELSKKAVEDNIFKVLARDAEIAGSKIDTFTNEALTRLNESFAAGDIGTIHEFEKQKQAIQEQAQAESIASQIAYLKDRASLLKAGSKERVQIEEQISQAELAISQTAADKRLEIQTQIEAKLKELQQVAFDGARQIAANLFEAADQDRELELERLQENFEKETELAGDNEEAKLAIKKQFDEATKKIELEQRAAKRKQAIIEKALAAFEILVNTAKGVAGALGYGPPGIPLAALIAAIGAVQLAVVLSKPIPAFAEGTDDAPGGWAIVNELGQERIVDKYGKAHVINTDGPTLAYIPQHSKVYTADETARINEFENYSNQVGHLKNGVDTVVEVSGKENMKEVTDAINRRMLSLEQTIRMKSFVNINYTKRGAEIILQNAEANTKFLNEFYS